MDVEIRHPKSSECLALLHNVPPSTSVSDLRRRFQADSSKPLERIALKSDPRGKLLKDDATLESLDTKILYFKDLGPQVPWTTVFLFEYTGPLLIYPIFYARPELIYGAGAAVAPRAQVVTTALFCWTFHYLKRDLETLFIHRFSHGTMPLSNLFKNCSYYWGFAAWIAYLINHPLYTSPDSLGSNVALGAFVLCELGNFFIHKSLRDLRPPGSRVRQIPRPTANPFTWLFTTISCPNYFYEVGAWFAFSIMTQCAASALFSLVGLYQMTVWAVGKHRNYLRDFKDYPKGRRAILPFLI